MPSRRRAVVDPAEQTLHGFARRERAEEGPPVPAVEPPERVAEERDGVLRQSGDPGLGLVHLKPEPRHKPPHPRHRLPGLAGAAADHEVVA